ncbi:DMT family transporter [Tardiphaga alba]|uniref:DMT family transporter n=1 Tax=Tardiphaga alba TaxID=340268 RepID=A0ABX8AD19_9BRAD|nr:DMT family transporter [Tardiphaga alba]QUS40308.1 DMT family transporter [Tardiphaga alba]
MGEFVGVLAAALSSALGGASIGVTRFVRDTVDPPAIGAFRFGFGFAFLLPVALAQKAKWPARADWAAVGGLGLLFFALFPILFNASLIFTTAARGSLALSTLPLLTMVVAACLGVERLTPRKTTGVLIAMTGVALALLSGLTSVPPGAWRGDALMLCAAVCMAFYSVWSRPFIRRSGPLQFTTMGMGVGALCLVCISAIQGSFAPVAHFGLPQWSAMLYLGLFGSALTFFLWSYALSRTTPTRVTISITVNPIAATSVGAVLLGEPIGWPLIAGILAVAIGIWIATTTGQTHSRMSARPD